MKKLALIVIVAALCMFISAAVASGDSHRRRGFHGVYAMTATGSCFNSFSEFVPGQVVTAPTAFVATFVDEGIWTFERRGTGTFSGNRFGMSLPPFKFSSAAPSEIKFDFSYTITHDGEIEIVVDPLTFSAKFLAGKKGRPFILRSL